MHLPNQALDPRRIIKSVYRFVDFAIVVILSLTNDLISIIV